MQWACAMVLLVLFMRRYDWESHKEKEPNAVSPGTIKKTVISFAIVVLSISLLFLWHNDDAWTKPAMSWGFVVYIGLLGFWMFSLKFKRYPWLRPRPVCLPDSAAQVGERIAWRCSKHRINGTAIGFLCNTCGAAASPLSAELAF
ncbi:hypothetical protein B0H63DRAFT_529119 [Podospora didyma]|uniref:Uncharacterized protein n=1 Tax=Podospora didyma TaxID=330526 RepID=A0AAE0K365_9PEZI|nr:hypothetical protein B0H63DRAFT_529119 [Podospora didyma]